MKWLLWTQIVLVLASVAVLVVGMSTSRYGGMLGLAAGGLIPLVLIAGSVLGLVALKRKKGHIQAGIVLLTPLALAIPSAFTETYQDEGWFAYAPSELANDISRTLQWLNWSLWLTVAAVVSAVQLFRRRES